jgi:hypothetical protein
MMTWTSDVSGIPFPDSVATGWVGDIELDLNLTTGLDSDEDLEDDCVIFICWAVCFEGESVWADPISFWPWTK